MTDNSPRSPDRKLGFVAPVTIAVVLALILLAVVLLRDRSEPPKAAPPPPPPPVAAPVAIQAPDPPLNRADLLKEISTVAAAYAAGSPPKPAGRDPLIGRRFAIRIPFGCEGPQIRAGGAQAFYEFDPQKRTVRLVARPADWTSSPLVQDLSADGKIEVVEGFWIPHPWSYAEACPPQRDEPVPASPTPPAAQTLGLASLFEKGASRLAQRRDRPYEQVIKLKDDDGPPLAQGYRLALEGRLTSFPDGRVAHCWSESPDHRPICLYAVQFERVAFESGKDGELLAEWHE